MKKSFDPGRIQPLHFLKCVFCLFLCLLLCFPSLQPVSAAQSADQNRETESQENTSVSGPEVSAPSAELSFMPKMKIRSVPLPALPR